MKWSFLLLLAIGAACTMAMPVMELSTEGELIAPARGTA